MNDRELLELAAKAIKGVFYESVGGFAITIEGKNKLWNPLTDEGDALRLAVKLNFRININEATSEIIYKITQWDESVYAQLNNGDKCEATRRAIVRAAAEIGRAM